MRHHQTIVIKRNNRKKGDGAHGGAWKVAFADFTMAMMAFFMIMWLTSSTSEEERSAVSAALRDYSLLDGGPNPFKFEGDALPLDMQTYPSLVEGIARDMLEGGGNESRGEVALDQSQRKVAQSLFDSGFQTYESMKVLKDVIDQMGEELGAESNLSVEIVPQGLRIRLQDDENRQMFIRGGTTMDPYFEDLLMNLAPVLGKINNGLVISGHTDATPFESIEYGNWELSGERASMARQVLSYGGMPEANLIQVNAMADKMLVNEEDPQSSENRRIEILILTKKAENNLMGLFDDQARASQINELKQQAKSNQPVTR